MRNVSDKSCRENHNTLFVFYTFLFSKIALFVGYVVKYRRAGQATDENMVHAHCVLDT